MYFIARAGIVDGRLDGGVVETLVGIIDRVNNMKSTRVTPLLIFLVNLAVGAP